MPAAHTNQNALRSNLPRYQRFFFSPACNDNLSSVLKTILLTRVAPKGHFCAVGSRSENGALGTPSRVMEGSEEEETWDFLLKPTGSSWPLSPA